MCRKRGCGHLWGNTFQQYAGNLIGTEYFEFTSRLIISITHQSFAVDQMRKHTTEGLQECDLLVVG